MDYEKILSTVSRMSDEHDMLLTVFNAAKALIEDESGASFDMNMDSLAEAVYDYAAVFGPHEPTPCADCGTDTTPWADGEPTGPHEWYMVRNDLWAAATRHRPARFLCIACLESRIGRQLNMVDFPEVPINYPDLDADMISERLRQRLTAPPH